MNFPRGKFMHVIIELNGTAEGLKHSGVTYDPASLQKVSHLALIESISSNLREKFNEEEIRSVGFVFSDSVM